MSKTDQVIEVAIGDTFDVHENGGALDGQRWGTDDMCAPLLDREGLQLVVVLDRWARGKGG